MFPQVPSGAGVVAVPASRVESPVVSAAQGVTPVSLDPHAPRAAAPPVGLAGDTGVPVKQRLEVTSDLRSGAQTAPLAAGAVASPAATLDSALQSLLQRLQAWGLAAMPEASTSELLNWPAGNAPVADTPEGALAQLRDDLGRSAMFAFHPRIASMLGAAERRSASERGASASTPPDARTGLPSISQDVADSLAAENAGEATDTGRAMPLNSPTLSIDQAQQGLQLLLQGRLRWEGELTPGVPAELERNDVWEEDPDRPGTLQRGTSVRVKVSLPDSGELVVVAQQIADRYTVALQPDARHLGRFDAAISDLQQALAPLTPNPVALTLQPPAPGSAPLS